MPHQPPREWDRDADGDGPLPDLPDDAYPDDAVDLPAADPTDPPHPIMTRWLGIRSWREARKAVAATIAASTPILLDIAVAGDPVELEPIVGPFVVLVVTFLVGNDDPPTVDTGTST